MWQSASPKRKEGAAVQPPPGEKRYLGSVERELEELSKETTEPSLRPPVS